MTPAETAAAMKALADLYGKRPADDETVDPDVAEYVRAMTEGLEGQG
jgi:hypothetical protein